MTLEDLAFPPPFEGPIRGFRGISDVTLPATRAPVYAQNILGLDLGTNTGWAIRRRDGSQACGTVKFPNRKRAHPGRRWVEFRDWLTDLLHVEYVHVIAYENVHRHLGCEAAHVYGAFKAMVEMAADVRNIELLPVGVGVVKKAFTGDGRAAKAAMLAEARRRGFSPDSDNSADALAVLAWAVMQEVA